MTDLPGTPEPGTPEPGMPEAAPEERLPAIRPPVEPVVSAERFSSPAGTRAFGLTPERAATIVRQSGSARAVGFLAVAVVVVFVAIYYLYELGFPGPLGGLPFLPDSRLAAEKSAQQVTAIEAGYNVYEANCARCHGVNGEGGIGPVLNDQAKLYQHLNENYLHNVLTVGGRYVCGNPNSLMPVWADVGNPPGPLNYVQINDVIAFIRAEQGPEYVMRDPNTLEPLIDPATGKERTFQGWRDPAYTPAPDATPVPACWSSAFSSPAPSGSAAPGGSPAPSASGGAVATTLQIAALNIQYDKTDLEAPANAAFAIDFDNQDAGIPHNVAIKDASGADVFKGEIVTGPTKTTYQVPALAAGTYTFYCSVHPNMTGTLTIK
jgi:mono/diheme cytochrome c family protein/plastocyanin